MFFFNFKKKKQVDRTIKGINELIDLSQIYLSEKDIKTAREELSHNEWGLAFNIICTQLYEYNIRIPSVIYLKAQEIGQMMKLESDIWQHLKDLVIDPSIIKLPIILNSNNGTGSGPGDVMIYERIEVLASGLEAIDVINHEYEGYDAEGRLLCLWVNDTSLELWGPKIKILVEPAEESPGHAEYVRELLIYILEYRQYERQVLLSMSLEELVRESLKFKEKF